MSVMNPEFDMIFEILYKTYRTENDMKWHWNMKIKCLIVDPIGKEKYNNYWYVSFKRNLILNC